METTCIVPVCDRPADKGFRGMCQAHYHRERNGKDINVPIRSYKPRNQGPERICEVPGCGRPHDTKGLCAPHNLRRRKGADLYNPPMPPYQKRPETIEEHIQRNTALGGPDGDCILWTGRKGSGSGDKRYGSIVFNGEVRSAHRLAWERERGPIPDGWEIDHNPKCPKNCMNVEHLQCLSSADHRALTMSRDEERPAYFPPSGTRFTCSIEGCETPVKARKMCDKH